MGLALGTCFAFADGLIPIEDFARPPSFRNVTLNPAGTHVAYIREHEGIGRLCVADVATMKPIAMSAGESAMMQAELSIVDVDWVGPKRLLAKTRVRDIHYGGWLAVDRDNKNGKPLSGHVGEKGTKGSVSGFYPIEVIYNANNDRTVLVSNPRVDLEKRASQYPDVVRLDTRGGVAKTVVANPGNVTRWVADRNGVVRIGVEAGEDEDSIIYRENEKDAWRKVATFKGRLKVRPMSFAADGKTVYVRAKTPANTWGFYRYDPSKNELGEEIWSNAKYDGDILRLRKSTDELLGVSYMADLPKTEWFDEKYRAMQVAIDEALPNRVNVLDIHTAGSGTLLVRSFSDRAPDNFYVLDVNKMEHRKIGTSRKWIDPEAMSPMHPIMYAARDGLEINGYLTVPRGQKPHKLPLVVMPHGGPFGVRDEWEFDPLVQMLANRGYAVLQMNYRGSGGYGLEFAEKGKREVGGKIQDDIEDATRWAIAKNVADPDRIVIVGSSFGGYSALFALGKSRDLYRCGISIAGVTDWLAIFKDIDPEFDQAKRFWREAISDPENEERMKEISPVNFAGDIKAPVLIIQGKLDFRVNPRQAKSMIAALEKAGNSPEALFVPNEGHGMHREESRVAVFKAIEVFLAKHLVAKAP
jgi:dipeptidyl aminopeptidase/acylaminoacyl peptidase